MAKTGRRIAGMTVGAWVPLVTAGLLAWGTSAVQADEWHTSPACWKEPRAYQVPFDPQFAGRIGVESTALVSPSASVTSATWAVPPISAASS